MRNHSLDVLRAAAVLLVFCYHSEGALLISRFGWTGVDLFFVLSGFLVSGLLFREYQAHGSLRLGRFLIRRGFKIYPPFYVLIAATVLYTIPYGGPRPASLASELLFFQSYFPGLWSHTWSLAVEEHFYLLLAAGFWLLTRRPKGQNPFSTLPKWIAGICLATIAFRTVLWAVRPDISERLQVFPSHLRFDSLLAGVLVAYYQSFYPTELAYWMRRLGGWIPPVSILLLAPVAFLLREDAFMVTLGFSLVSWGFALLLLSVLYPPKPAKAPGRMGRAMARLGQNSYAFYLWHAPILLISDSVRPMLAARGIEISLLPNLLGTLFISIGVSFAATRLVEVPALRLRDRYFPSGAPPASVLALNTALNHPVQEVFLPASSPDSCQSVHTLPNL